MKEPKSEQIFVMTAGVGVANRIRLPDCEHWEWGCDAGPVSLRYNYGGDNPSGFLEVLGAAGLSQVHVPPGIGTFVEFLGAAGIRVWVQVS